MKVLQFKQQSRKGNSTDLGRDTILYVLLGVTLIYTTVVGLFARNTCEQVAEQQISQKLVVHQLETRQLETETQLTVSTQALARRLGLDEHQLQVRIDAMPGNSHVSIRPGRATEAQAGSLRHKISYQR